MTQTALEIINLTKLYTGIPVVDDISFSISEGKITAVLGPNGAGKTTTINMILGLIKPTRGQIRVLGIDALQEREKVLKLMNFSSTYTNFPWSLTVKENLTVLSYLYGVEDKKGTVLKVMERLGLDEFRDRKTRDLSSGWNTRLNIARIFINNPRLILLDEPTASLDPESAAVIRREVIRFKNEQNAAVLWTSHNMPEIEEVSDDVIFLKKGKIISRDTPANLSRIIRHARVNLIIEKGAQILVRICQSFSWEVKFWGRHYTVTLKDDEIYKLLNLLGQNRVVYSEISIDKPDLNDYFLSIAKNENIS